MNLVSYGDWEGFSPGMGKDIVIESEWGCRRHTLATPSLNPSGWTTGLRSLSPNHVLGLALSTFTKCTDHLPYDLFNLGGQDLGDAPKVSVGCEDAGTVPQTL